MSGLDLFLRESVVVVAEVVQVYAIGIAAGHTADEAVAILGCSK